jgi:hypothetical protein
MSNILVLGDGLLGSEIVKQTGWDYISRKKDGIDFEFFFTYLKLLENYDQIINCIGYTDTYSTNREKHWKVNFLGVIDLADYCCYKYKKLIHISTDYLYAGNTFAPSEENVPVHAENWYSYTKLLSDGYIQAKLKKYLIIRTSFKPRPFPYPEVIFQEGNFDYVDKISELIIMLIEKNANGIFNVGTIKKTMMYLAEETIPNIQYKEDMLDESQPTDVSMNINKLNNFLEL